MQNIYNESQNMNATNRETLLQSVGLRDVNIIFSLSVLITFEN